MAYASHSDALARRSFEQIHRELDGTRRATKTVMHDVLTMLLGAGLVSTGVLASALADRIRGLRISKPIVREPRDERPEPRKRASGTPANGIPVEMADGADDVIAALMGAGFKKPIATRAVAACSPEEQASLKTWLAAALRIAGGKS